ncbi:hypothetical protein FKG94_19980 [Exilibacterium tricleocarpae]|uniref:Uncharacterized protein n=1 Tax=Exilibacterium tricleocarpae TaxID=2591008 RepID=A0A545T1U4_9GAMM|nr:hypothetical protein [Exilibacterium tricleocarpae]TQV71169.1 hypothetical protein FKG94_19980 [Exilibacterium tricleocarpae]
MFLSQASLREAFSKRVSQKEALSKKTLPAGVSSRSRIITTPAFAVIALLLLGGCAGQVNMLPTLSEQTRPQADQGVVVARVINASAYPLPFNQLTITPENLNESRQIKPERLVAPYPLVDSSSVFSAPVAAGSYSLSSIRAFYSNGDYWYSRFVSADARFGTFEVRPGQVTDLGTIIYYPKSQEDKYMDMLLRLPASEPGEVLAKYFPFYPVEPADILSWDSDDYDEERESLYVSAAQNPVTYDASYLAPDDSLYFLAKLGVIVKRTADGEWELDAVDTNLDLNAIAQNNNGDIVVGGGEGRLFWKPAGADWRDISLDHSYAIEELLFNGNTIGVLARQRTKLSLMRADIATGPIQWQAVDHYTSLQGWHSMPAPEEGKSRKKSPQRPRKIADATLSAIGDETYLTVRTLPARQDPVFTNSKPEVFGYRGDAWQVYVPENKPDVAAVVQAGAIKLGIKLASFWSWSGRPSYLKYVESSGQWEEIATYVLRCGGEISADGNCAVGDKTIRGKRRSFSLRTVPWFKNDRQAIAAVAFSNVNPWSGERSVDTKLLATEDGGKSWSDTGHSLPKPYCYSFVPEVTDRLMVSCNGSSGDFYESLDNGASWEHVRQHENF